MMTERQARRLAKQIMADLPGAQATTVVTNYDFSSVPTNPVYAVHVHHPHHLIFYSPQEWEEAKDSIIHQEGP